MDNIEHAARAWHKDSDHAHDGAPFGSPTCNCLSVAKRLAPMLSDAWDEGYADGHSDGQMADRSDYAFHDNYNDDRNPYRKGN